MVLIVVGVIVVVGALALTLMSTNDTKEEMQDEATVDTREIEVSAEDTSASLETEVEASDTTTTSDTTYNNGSYNIASTYRVPSGHEEAIRVSLELDNDVVTSASVDFDGDIGTSRLYQAKFESAYQEEVVGKPIDDISLVRVGGASLSSEAFNKAVAEVKTKAS